MVNDEPPECRLLREQWQQLTQRDISVAVLQAFYARYKYLVMSRHLSTYQQVGALLANADKRDLAAIAQRLFELLMQALTLPPSRGGNVNALLHMSGYFKQQLPPEEKRVLNECIEQYGRGDIELSVPVALLRSYLLRFPNAYIEQQVFLKTT